MELTVNGKARSVDVEPDALLLHVLREQLDLSGTKYGCGEGQCGACTVLIDGKPRRACITPVKAAAGRQVTTVEGLERNGRLHPLQQAFLDLDVMQCGYCTPGMIVTGAALLAASPNPSEQEIIRFMQGNICRCGTYQRIVAAIRQAASAKAG